MFSIFVGARLNRFLAPLPNVAATPLSVKTGGKTAAFNCMY